MSPEQMSYFERVEQYLKNTFGTKLFIEAPFGCLILLF